MEASPRRETNPNPLPSPNSHTSNSSTSSTNSNGLHAPPTTPDGPTPETHDQIRLRQPVPDHLRPGRHLLLQASSPNADRILRNRQQGHKFETRPAPQHPAHQIHAQEAAAATVRLQALRATQQLPQESQAQPSNPNPGLQFRLLAAKQRDFVPEHSRFPGSRTQPGHAPHPDPFDRSGSGHGCSHSQLNKEAEEKAIKEKGFYLHPSPTTTPRESEPRLLPLFPTTSPRASGSSSS
ncbi:hypothetical protein M0R45_013234 [Rubus argutus]|uniref:Uncharacterized protein n=1 Tax=Rubus argutus TaxID=59490 RepID=A0AAW1XKK2_RUBAR